MSKDLFYAEVITINTTIKLCYCEPFPKGEGFLLRFDETLKAEALINGRCDFVACECDGFMLDGEPINPTLLRAFHAL